MPSYSRFNTELTIRPDDVDMNNHVHASKYLDYFLAARYDQMGRCYGMSMKDFVTQGWTWFIKSVQIGYKRPLQMGDTVVVRAWIMDFDKTDVRVGFQIFRKDGMKLAAEGWVLNTMVSTSTGRATEIPDWVVELYTKHVEEKVPSSLLP